MSYVFFNPNPRQKSVGDCVIRAVAAVMDVNWNAAYMDMVAEGFVAKDMPSSNDVLNSYLMAKGFERETIPNSCLRGRCYTVKQFCHEHPEGHYILATGTHVVAVMDGRYFDAWDSGNEVPIYYWRKENEDANTELRKL